MPSVSNKAILTEGLLETGLFELTDRLYRAGSLSEAYEIALDGIVELLGCQRASLLQFDAAGIMRFVAWRGLSEGYRNAVDGHSPWTPRTKDPEPIFVSDIDETSESNALKETIKTEGIRGLAFVPLTANRFCVGKFMTYYRQSHTFTDREKQIGQMIARQVSYCIERQLADSAAARLRALVSSSTDAIVAIDLAGTIQHWNRGAEQLFGYAAEEVVGTPVWHLLPKDRVAEVTGILERIQKGESVENFETVRQRKDGSLVHVSLTVSPIIDAAGKIIGASRIARDITSQHLARERQELLLREMSHRVKNLFAVTASIINLHARTAPSVQEFASSLADRLGALGRSHALTMESNGAETDASFFALVQAIFEPYKAGENPRFSLTGTDFQINGRIITSMSLLLHELATNAAKYGSLANETGHVEIQVAPRGDAVEIIWKEVGGPKPKPSKVPGFGSRLMEATIVQLGGKIDHEWQESGLMAKLVVKPK